MTTLSSRRKPVLLVGMAAVLTASLVTGVVYGSPAAASCSASTVDANISGTDLATYTFTFNPIPHAILAAGINYSLFTEADYTNATYGASGSNYYETLWMYDPGQTNSQQGVAYATYC